MTDWNELRVRYITGSMNLKQLADEAGISYSQVSKHASQERWREQRKQFGKNAANDALASARARAQADIERAMETTSGLLKVAADALKDKDQFRRYLVVRTDGSGGSETTEEVFRKVDTKAIKELTEAVDKLTAMLRVFYDEPTEEEKLQRESIKLRNRKTREDIRKTQEDIRKTQEDVKKLQEDRDGGDREIVLRIETEEEYRARTGSTETESEAADLSE